MNLQMYTNDHLQIHELLFYEVTEIYYDSVLSLGGIPIVTYLDLMGN